MTYPLNLGIRLHDVEGKTFEERIKKVASFGLSHVQLAPLKVYDELSKIQDVSQGFAMQSRQILRKYNVDICVLGSYINLSHLDENVRQDELDKFYYSLKMAESFGAGLVGTETGSVGKGYTEDNFTEEAYQIVKESVQKMVKIGEQFGKIVAIEAGVNHPIYTVDHLLRLVEDVNSENIQVILDPVNLMTLENYHNQTEITKDAFKRLDPYIQVIHLKDFDVQDGKLIPVAVGQGLMDHKPYIEYAKYHRPGVQISFEDTKDKDLQKSLDYIADLYEQV